MKENSEKSRIEFLEHVALPMGNLSRTLEALLDQDLEMDSQDLKQGLRNIQANAESIYQFLTCKDEKPTSVVGRRTPEVLRQFVVEKRRAAHLPAIVEN